MSSVRIQFYLNEQNQYLLITALEDRIFAVHLEAGEPDDASSEESARHVPKPPDLLLQRTNRGNWTILEEGDIRLSADELKLLGRRIEAELPSRI